MNQSGSNWSLWVNLILIQVEISVHGMPMLSDYFARYEHSLKHVKVLGVEETEIFILFNFFTMCNDVFSRWT